MMKLAKAAGLICSVIAACGVANAAEPRIMLGGEQVEGVTRGDVTAYLGLPFAAPPIGTDRWRGPQPPVRSSTLRKADHYAASCAQEVAPAGFGPWSHEYVVQGSASEDCLYLNVWAPAAPRRAHLPVMVWIHGGGFSSGSGSVPIYEGRNLASRGIIVVSINYRLGVFGFLAHPELTRTAGGAAPTNFGLQDQIAALRWVRANIAALGGDPDAVTIAGQSAGSMSVHALIASPLAKGLFQRAIAESGLPDIIPPPTLQEAERTGVAFAQAKGANSLAALRAMTTAQLLARTPGAPPMGIPFLPVVDRVVLPAAPIDLVAQGRAADVPMLVGQNADEASAMTPGYGSSSAADYAALMTRTFGDKADRFSRLYPSATDAERGSSSKAMLADRGLAAIGKWARTRAAHATTPVYGYYFTHVEPGPVSTRYGAFHSSEIPYALATLDAAPERGFTAVDRSVMSTVSGYWVNFIRSGNPNGGGLPGWPRLDGKRPQLLEIGDQSKARALLRPDLYAAYAEYAAQGGRLSMF